MADEQVPEVPPAVVAEPEPAAAAPESLTATVFEAAGNAAAKVINAVEKMAPRAPEAMKTAAAKAVDTVTAAAPKARKAVKKTAKRGRT
jgi:hypothetical protein